MSLLKLRQNYGLTLVEVSIAMAISLMAIVAILSVFISSSKIAVESVVRNKAAMEARSVIDRFTTDARTAVTVEASFGGYTTDATTIILRVPSLDADGFPVDVDNTFDRIIYHEDPSSEARLMRTVIADGTSSRVSESTLVGESMAPGIYAIQPDPVGDFIIYYRFRSVHQVAGKTIEVPAAGSVQLRNHT